MKNRVWRRFLVGNACLGICIASAAMAAAEDWTGFRGARGLGKAEATNLPSAWDSKTNVVWKRELPGLGGSSPIILGSRVFVTCYSGYAQSIEDPGKMESLQRHVVCVDRKTGEILWKKTLKANMPESEYKGGNNTRHGYASSTPTTDGERLYVFFGASGVYCFDLDGNSLWTTSVGAGTHGWGSGTSPLLYKDLLIVNASVESQSLIALNKNTGKEVWRAPDISSSLEFAHAGGRQRR